MTPGPRPNATNSPVCPASSPRTGGRRPSTSTCPCRFLVGIPALAASWLVPFYLFCFRAARLLGHNPTIKPEHHRAGAALRLHDDLVACWLTVVLLLVPAWFVAVPVARYLRPVSWRTALLWALLWLPLAVVWFLDPGGWFWWYFD